MTALLGGKAADQKAVFYRGGPKKKDTFGSAVIFIYLLQRRLPSLVKS
jgi:hypothetical protein